MAVAAGADWSDEVEASEELGPRLAQLHVLLRDLTVNGSLMGYEMSVVTSSAIGSLWRPAQIEGGVDLDRVAPEVHLVTDAAAAVDRALFDCPYGTRPSPVEWRYVPLADQMELRCLHEPPPGHCWEQQGRSYKRVACT